MALQRADGVMALQRADGVMALQRADGAMALQRADGVMACSVLMTLRLAASAYFAQSSAIGPVAFVQSHFSMTRFASLPHCWSTPGQLSLRAVQLAKASNASWQSALRDSVSLMHWDAQSSTPTAPSTQRSSHSHTR